MLEVSVALTPLAQVPQPPRVCPHGGASPGEQPPLPSTIRSLPQGCRWGTEPAKATLVPGCARPTRAFPAGYETEEKASEQEASENTACLQQDRTQQSPALLLSGAVQAPCPSGSPERLRSTHCAEDGRAGFQSTAGQNAATS